jgi:hypothetical protein
VSVEREDRSSAISDEKLEELAASGALCGECGGLHIPGVEVAILAANAARETGVKIPFCRCEDCPTCRVFREGLRDSLAAKRPRAVWSAD